MHEEKEVTQSTTEPPDSIWLPADTDADAWNILAKNPSRDWSTGEPANNIEYRRVVPASAAPVVGAKWDKSGLKEACQRGLAMGRYRQEFDLQLVLDMLLEIERLEAAAATAAPVEQSDASQSCQRCGRIGGKIVNFNYDSITTSRWICPHCLDANEEAC